MKDLGAIKRILGMKITRDSDKGKMLIAQVGYHGKAVNRFNMKDSKHVSVPLAQHFKLSSSQAPVN